MNAQLLKRARQLEAWNPGMDFKDCLALAKICPESPEIDRRQVLNEMIIHLENDGSFGLSKQRRLRELYREQEALYAALVEL